jgi:hypothetical protein
VAQVVVTMSKTNAPLVTTNGKNNEEATKELSTPIHTQSTLGSTFECKVLPIGNMLNSKIDEGYVVGLLA